MLRAIRDDETAVRTAGKNTLKVKSCAFAVSGFFAGLAGGIYGQYFAYIDPSSFTFNLSIVFTGLEKDLEFEREIRHYIKVPFVSLVGKTTLRQLGALIEKCKSFISPDSAPLHIAAALGKSTLGLFGPTDAQKHRPPNDKLLILQEKVDCGPCYKSTCSHHSCMVRLTPSRVISAYEKLQRV